MERVKLSARDKIMELKLRAEAIESCLAVIEDRIRSVRTTYECVGESTEQDRNWRTDELLWEDEEKTIPKMKKIYDYVEKAELTKEEQFTVDVYERLANDMAALADLVK